MAFEYAYDARGLVDERELSTDEASTFTDYTHDELGRLTESVTGDYVATYGWDAASNLVFEAVSEDLSTSKKNDGYTVTRSVNAINQLTSSVMDPSVMPASKTETTAYSYDARGNRAQALTTTTSGNKTKTVSDVVYTYDGRDLVSSVAGGDTDIEYNRDGVGRALEVTEDGGTRTRLYDGLAIVRDGDTTLTRGPAGAVLFEATSVTSGKGKKATTSIQTLDVLSDLLGSAVSTATDGVISADLALFGDFGDLLTDTSLDTVTGFTGQVDTAGLLEFASRSYDIGSRVWVQDDRYRGTVARASSLNRYAYVEGAPETYVDVLGFFRAAAALRAQQLAVLNAQLQSALGSLDSLYGFAIQNGQGMSADDMMRAYNNLAAGLDPAVKGVLDPIVGKLATGVKTFHLRQAIATMKQKLAENAYEKEKARAVAEFRAQMDLQIEALYAQAPGGNPNTVHEDRGFVGNRLEALKGYVGTAKDIVVDLAVTAIDFNIIMLNPELAVLTGSLDRSNQQIDAFQAGIEENGWGDTLNMTLNPVYHLIDAGASTIDSFNTGDFHGVGEGVLHTQMAFLETALVVVPGAGLVVSGGVKVAALATRATSAATTSLTKLTTKIAATSRAAGLASDAGSIQLSGGAARTAELARVASAARALEAARLAEVARAAQVARTAQQFVGGRLAAEIELATSRLGPLTYSPKIASQLAPRGWTAELVAETVSHPSATYRVWDYTMGSKLPATAFAEPGGGLCRRERPDGSNRASQRSGCCELEARLERSEVSAMTGASSEQRALIEVLLTLGVPFAWRSEGLLLIGRPSIAAVLEELASRGIEVLGLEGFELVGDQVQPRLDLIFDSSIARSERNPLRVVRDWPSTIWVDIAVRLPAR